MPRVTKSKAKAEQIFAGLFAGTSRTARREKKSKAKDTVTPVERPLERNEECTMEDVAEGSPAGTHESYSRHSEGFNIFKYLIKLMYF